MSLGMSIQSDLEKAVTLARSGRHKAAFKAAKAGMRQYKSHPAFPNIAAISCCAMGNERDAVPLFQTALKLKPDFHDARKNLAQALISLKKPQAAAKLLREAIALCPKDPTLRYLLAFALSEAGQFEQALQALEGLAEIAPLGADAMVLRAEIHEKTTRFEAAIADTRSVLALRPNDSASWARLSGLLARQAHGDAALEAIEKAAELKPDDSELQMHLASQLLACGQPDHAKVVLQGVLNGDPGNAAAIEQLARIANTEDCAGLTQKAQQALATTTKTSPDRASLLYALARLAELSQDSVQANQYQAESNRIMAAQTPYNRKAEQQLNEAIKARVATPMPVPENVPFLPAQPIFVLGLPRSGTTLAEAVLGAHPAVAPLGERSITDLLYPIVQNDLPFGAHDIQNLVTQDQAALPLLPEGTTAYVDKMPENHRWIGFLQAMYPGARFIHIRRDPRDIALSMWRGRFPVGALNYTYDWSSMAHRFNLYRDIMRHWQGMFPDLILDINYEDLVSDVHATSRQMAQHCELEWVEEMTRPDLHAGQVRTHSVHQLRQPVHKRSVGKWRREADLLPAFIGELDAELWPEIAK